MPYVFLLVDIISWWLTKLNPMFAWLVIFAGAGMAVSFVFMWAVSVLEMWWFEKVFINPQGERYPQWSVYLEGKFKEFGGEDAVRRLRVPVRKPGYIFGINSSPMVCRFSNRSTANCCRKKNNRCVIASTNCVETLKTWFYMPI